LLLSLLGVGKEKENKLFSRRYWRAERAIHPPFRRLGGFTNKKFGGWVGGEFFVSK
jgi:hypothetical protein